MSTKGREKWEKFKAGYVVDSSYAEEPNTGNAGRDRWNALKKTIDIRSTAPRQTAQYDSSGAKKGFFDRLGLTVSGGAKGSLAGNMDAMGVAYEAGQSGRTKRDTAELKDAQWAVARAKHDYDADPSEANKSALEIATTKMKAFADVLGEGAYEQALEAAYDAAAQFDTGDLEALYNSLGVVTPKTGTGVQQQATKATRDLAVQVQDSATEDIQEAKDGTSKFWQMAIDAGASATQMALDAVSNAVLGTNGSMVPFATRAFGGATMEARQGGADLGKQALYGAAQTAKEVFTEKMFNIALPYAKTYGKGGFDGIVENGIRKAADKLGKSKIGKAALEKVLTFGASAATEGMEELIGDWMEWQLPRIYGGDVATAEETLSDSLYDFVVGFMSGMIGGAMTGPMKAINSAVQAREVKKTYGAQQLDLVNKSEELSPGNELAKKYRERLDGGKNLSGRQLIRLMQQNETDMLNGDKAKIQAATEKRLTELGESDNVRHLAEIVARQMAGEELSRDEQIQIDGSKYGKRVLDELNPENVKVDENGNPRDTYSSSWTGSIGTSVIYPVTFNRNIGVTGAKYNPETGKLTIVSDKDKKLKLKTESGEIVDAKDVNFRSKDEAMVYSAVLGMGVNPVVAQSIVDNFDGTDGRVYAADVKLAYQYGKMNFPKSYLDKLDIKPHQAEHAYNLGRSDAKAEAVAPKTKRTVKGKRGTVIFETAVNESTLTPIQRQSINGIKAIADLSGLNVHVFESRLTKDGYKFTLPDGTVTGANGWYVTGTNDIWIDLNAGNAGEGTMLYTAAHEISHFIKEWSPTKWRVLADFLLEQYGEDVPLDALLERQMAKVRKNNPDLQGNALMDAAHEELVCDAMSEMLVDGEVVKKLAELKQKDKTLWEKIKDAIRDLLEKWGLIRKEYEGRSVAGEAEFLRGMDEAFKKLQQLYTEAFAEASENFAAAADEVLQSGAKPVTTGEIVTDGAVVVDGKGNKYSIRSMKADIAEGKMFDDLMKYCGWSRARVNELRKQLTDLVAYMEPHRDILDMNETYGREGRKFSPYKPNSDPLYQISMDFSTLCSKRLLTQYVIENLQLRENRPMSAEEQMAIRDMLIEYRQVEKGLQVACAMCYVEAARLKSPKQMQRWLDDPAPLLRDYFGKANKAFNDSVKEAQADFKESRGYARNAPKKEMSAADVRELKKIGPRMRAQYQLSEEEMQIVERAKSLPNSTYLTAGNLASLSETDPVIYRAYTSFVRTATRSKSLETDEPYYYGDSTRDNGNGIIVSDSFIEAVNRENGMRFSSWSDWRIQHLLDYITAVIDNSVRGAAMHGYTKFSEEVRVLGKTGMMFNLSGVAGTQTGLNPDGSLNFSPTESIDINDAIELREEFPETAGLQCIGVSDDHVFALLRSDIIDYVIPYHVSGLNAGLRRMADIYGWKNYTSTQHAVIDSSVKHNGQEHWHEEPVFSEFFVGYDTGMTGEEAMQESARRYVEMCRERGLTPKFEKFAKEPGYWKLLVDRKMINQKTGELIRQKPVTPTFDFDAIKAVVDRHVENYDSGMEARALSHIVKNWDSVPGRIRELKKRGTKKAKAQKALDTLHNEMMAAQPKTSEVKRSERDAEATGQYADGVKFSERVTDKETLKFLNGQKTITTYKTMQLVDGNLYPPMAARTEGKYEDYSILGKWEQATEHPELITDGNQYKLDKGKGQGSLKAAYNPYMHSSNLVINDQFSGAYSRPQLVTVECEVPVSELTSGYHAQYAKDSVGWHAWHTGTVAGQLRKARGIERQVFLSRWIKPVRIVPDSEVAGMYKDLLYGTDIAVPDNVVTPSLLAELKKAGVKTKESGKLKMAERDDLTYAEITEKQRDLYQREMNLAERKREANSNPELLQAIDAFHGLSDEMRELLPKRRQGTATQEDLDRIEEIKVLRDVKLQQVGEIQERLGLKAMEAEDAEIRQMKEDLRVAADAAWKREGSERESAAISKAGVSAPEYFRKKALKSFKTTTNFNEAGYLLPDGKLLNFSGGERNHRYRDHREIGEIYEATQGAAALNRFMSDGNIRIMAESPGVDITSGVEPTKEQYDAIRRFVNANGVKSGKFFVDFSDAEGHRAGNYFYEGRVSADRVINDIKHFYATGEIRAQSAVAQFRYSDRDTDSVSNRDILANAFMDIAQDDVERGKIAEYQQKIKALDEDERKLRDIRAQLHDLSFSAGPRDNAKIRELREKATKLANRIGIQDKQLLRLEASKPLMAVLEREKKLAYSRASQKWEDRIETARTGRSKTEMRHKIKKIVGELNNLLLHGTKDKHIMIGLQKATAEALSAINMDTVAAENRLAKIQAKIDKATDPAEKARLQQSYARVEAMGDNMATRLTALKNAYEEIKDSSDPLVANAYQPEIEERIKNLRKMVGDTPLRNMSMEQLEFTYDTYKMVLTTIRNANKAFKNERGESIAVLGNRAMEEIGRVGGKKEIVASAMRGPLGFAWSGMKPTYAFKAIGSDTLSELFSQVRAGEDVWATDVNEAKEFYSQKTKQYHYDSWDLEKEYTFTSKSGKEFKLTLEQIMSLYAYSKRKQADAHLDKGGFVYDSSIEVVKRSKLGIPVKYRVNTAHAHALSRDTLMEICKTLTDEQVKFVDEMQDYLSVMGEKGNEVSLKMYGVKIFKEKFYFPLKSAKQFMYEQYEVAGDRKIKNSGFSKDTTPHASNPVILNNFTDVWATHVNDMAMYHAFVLPMEDFERVFNYKTPTSDTMPTESVKGYLQDAYGVHPEQYIKQLMTDLNGGARIDPTAGIINKGIALFKKSAVFASLSVVIQQPSAIARAMAYIDAKYFVGKPGLKDWDEVKKYAPVAIIKEMGYFDTNMGKSTVEFIKAKEYTGVKSKMKALVTDSQYRDEILSKAPSVADELAWCQIWNAVKKEIAETKKLQGEELLQAAGKRFTEVIVNTQVYDSVLTRSGMMRSKDTGMKMATSFMAEPTTSLNMIADALIQGKRGNKGYSRKTIGAVAASMILNSILVSFVYAGRDDDEDKTYIEKYAGSLTSELIDSFNPLTLIPFVKDIVSIAQGYDVERSDMAVITDLFNAWKKLSSDNLSVYRKVEGFGGAIASIFGLPLKNIMRDVRGIYNTVKSAVAGPDTTGRGVLDAARESLPKWMGGGERSNADQLYAAMLSGDTGHVERLKARFKDDRAFTYAVRDGLVNNDKRITAAAEARAAGNQTEYMRLAREIVNEGHFSQDDVVRAVNYVLNRLTKK